MASTAPPSTNPRSSGTKKAELLRRAQTVAQIRHPNLVRMMQLPGGAGFLPVSDGAQRLHDFMLPVGTFRRFDLARVLRLLLDVLSGLRALHEARIGGAAGFVHGQVSPKHIYLDQQGNARLVPLVGAHVIPVLDLLPTGYLAPEQLLGRAVDVRADVFSIGILLWEALSGTSMLRNLTSEAALERLQKRKLVLPQLSADLAWAEPLKAIALRALALSPEERWSSARELRDAIVDAVGVQVAALGGDSWPDEAPTPVLQPRLHFMPSRGRGALPRAPAPQLSAQRTSSLPEPSPLPQAERFASSLPPLRGRTPPPAVIHLPDAMSTAAEALPKVRFRTGRLLSAFGLAVAFPLAVLAWRERAELNGSPARAGNLQPSGVAQVSQPLRAAAASRAGEAVEPAPPVVSVTPSASAAPAQIVPAPAATAGPSVLVPKRPRLKPAARKPAPAPKRSTVEDDVARYGI